MKKILTFCLLLVALLAGCSKKPRLVRIKDLPKQAVEISDWDCDGIGENDELLNPKKCKGNSNPEIVSLVRNAVAELDTVDTGDENMSPCMNLLCFTTKGGKNYCIDINYDGPLWGTEYTDAEGKLEAALEKAGLMPVPFEPDKP